MARAIFLTIFTLLFVVVYAVPKQVEHKQHKHFKPDDIVNALNMGIIARFHTVISLESLVTNLVRIDFDVKNPLPIELTIENISVSAGLNDTQYLGFNHTFEEPGLVLPGSGTNNTGLIGNALLVRGALNFLGIIPAGVLDVLDMNASINAATKFRGKFGISLEVDHLKQDMVPATYDLTVGGVEETSG